MGEVGSDEGVRCEVADQGQELHEVRGREEDEDA